MEIGSRMRWARIVVVVIGSGWFFPVSCTASLFAGTHIVAKLDERAVNRGDSIHSRFSMVIESGRSDEPFRQIKLEDLPRHEEILSFSDSGDTPSFLLSVPSGQFDSDSSSITYQVIEETSSGQIIEVVESDHDGDNTIWSRYEATHSTITPIGSRMFYFGYMFSAIPYALGTALILYATGRTLQRRYQESSGTKEDA